MVETPGRHVTARDLGRHATVRREPCWRPAPGHPGSEELQRLEVEGSGRQGGASR